MSVAVDQEKSQPTILSIKEEATEYIFKRETCNDDKEQEQMFQDLCNTLMRFLGPNDVSPEVTKKFEKLYAKIGRIEQDMQGFEYIMSNVKGLSKDNIDNKIEERAFGIEMKIKQMNSVVEDFSTFVMENTNKHEVTNTQMSNMTQEIQTLTQKVEHLASRIANPNTQSGTSLHRVPSN